MQLRFIEKTTTFFYILTVNIALAYRSHCEAVCIFCRAPKILEGNLMGEVENVADPKWSSDGDVSVATVAYEP